MILYRHLRSSSFDLRYCRLSGVSSANASSIQTSAVETDDHEPLESAALHSLDYGGVDIGDWLDENSQVMLAVMAGGPIDPWYGPELVVSLGGVEVFTYRLAAEMSHVDDMFRFGNLRAAAENPTFVPNVPALQPKWDQGRKDLDVFFSHGFNVNEVDAHKWGRILFKRFWLSGFNARFHMLTWEGNCNWTGNWANGLHYQHDVWYALRTGAALKRYVEAAQSDASKRVLMTQSLGNMVACEALHEGLQVAKYFMFDAAVPSEAGDGTLRRVTAMIEVRGQMRRMVFFTNNLEWSAKTVAELYRARWAVELFFKELKQTCQLHDFVGYNENAVKWQIWTGLLVHFLLRFLKFLAKWKLSFSRLAGVVRASVWVRRKVVQLLEMHGTAGGWKSDVPKPLYLQGFPPFTMTPVG